MPVMNALTLFKCLSDETRLHLVLLLLRRGESCVCDLIGALQLSQPKISRHLQPLREAGLLLAEKRGQWVYYRVNPQLEPWAMSILSSAQQAQAPELEFMLSRAGGECCN